MAVTRRDISERIGLDYLIESAREERAANAVPETAQVDSHLLAFAGRAVLETISRLAQKGEETPIRLSDISEELKMGAEVLVPLARKLEKLGLVATLERSSFGDNCVKLTSEATKLLEEPDRVVLMERLGLH